MITREISNETVIDNEICEAMTIMDRTKRTLGWAKARVDKYDFDSYREELLEARTEYEAAADDYLATEANYMGWSRFWLVTNTGGHIHSSLNCSTTRPTTSWAWLTELAGRTEDEAVEEYGAILCTVCYPSAPVEYTGGVNKKEAARKAFDRAMREINKTPEGKAVKRIRESIKTKAYNVPSWKREIARVEDDKAAGFETPEHMVVTASGNAAKIAKAEKAIVKLEAKLVLAEAALEAALNGEAR
jgi:hypothetical protein